MKIVIDIPDEMYQKIKEMNMIISGKRSGKRLDCFLFNAVNTGIQLTPRVLADLLMEERIKGGLKQDVSYSKEVIDDVRCRLTVDIIDRRPCYCGAELREVWRERKEG